MTLIPPPMLPFTPPPHMGGVAVFVEKVEDTTISLSVFQTGPVQMPPRLVLDVLDDAAAMLRKQHPEWADDQ